MEAGAAAVPGHVGSRRALGVAAALATFWFSAAIGAIAFQRWKRGAIWLATDWLWFAVMIAGVHGSRPHVMWGGLIAFVAWRIPAAIDAYRLAQIAREQAGWPTLIRAWVVLTVGATLVLLGLVRPFFVEAFTMPSGSMIPTLEIGDHFYVDKLARTPARGEVVVFKFPVDPSTDYVKRVIGLAGDTIEMRDGQLTVNGHVVERERDGEGCPEGEDGLPTAGEGRPCLLWRETLDGRRYRIGTERSAMYRGTPRTHVPPGTVYVLGDNRDNSSDSRVWGTVPLENIKGTVRFVYWSKGPQGTRWDRVNLLVR